MGYQESWVIANPQRKFNKLLQIYDKLEKAGYYEDMFSIPPRSVIVLKQDIGDIPAGTKIFWVCGERGFINEKNIFDRTISMPPFCFVEIIPVESVFMTDVRLAPNSKYEEIAGTMRQKCELYTDGIDFGDSAAPSENAYLKRYSMSAYLSKIRSEKENER